ncbi:hypothetical protein B5F41_02155 [Gordonibacter sp. An232A]|nr:hypothetical protein B5F41_02155 [Gordonibacter sp. An232A]
MRQAWEGGTGAREALRGVGKTGRHSGSDGVEKVGRRPGSAEGPEKMGRRWWVRKRRADVREMPRNAEEVG